MTTVEIEASSSTRAKRAESAHIASEEQGQRNQRLRELRSRDFTTYVAKDKNYQNGRSEKNIDFQKVTSPPTHPHRPT